MIKYIGDCKKNIYHIKSKDNMSFCGVNFPKNFRFQEEDSLTYDHYTVCEECKKKFISWSNTIKEIKNGLLHNL